MRTVRRIRPRPVPRGCPTRRSAARNAAETLIVVLRSLGTLREPAALFGWVRVIAVREAVRIARRSSRSVPAELIDLPAPGDPALATDIHDVLNRLSPEHRAVLTLRDLEGLDEQTAGAMLGVPTGTVRSRSRDSRGWCPMSGRSRSPRGTASGCGRWSAAGPGSVARST